MIRWAKKEENKLLVELVFVILRDMELSIFQIIQEEELKELILQAMEDPLYRFSYDRARVYIVDGNIAGVYYSYSGSEENIIDEPLKNIAKKRNVADNFSIYTDSEAYKNEWYIDSIITKKQHRGKGIASALLQDAETQTQRNGYTILSLNCEEENTHAKSVYLKNGFSKLDERTIENHQYDHMIKKIQ
ncbi:GNAT family N-acetyltransferase [Lacticigenium naphthae]|uniref:GNAT family N-acetyltransferase n=1 Tax=Lacticigenium naphthae TaxID=515351 RepID=UPI0003FBD206|nr:GNAT family N-acetyltransferase [Lacticigenium naphthae]